MKSTSKQEIVFTVLLDNWVRYDYVYRALVLSSLKLWLNFGLKSSLAKIFQEHLFWNKNKQSSLTVIQPVKKNRLTDRSR